MNYTLKLEQNRSDRPRYTRIIRYETGKEPEGDNLGTLKPVGYNARLVAGKMQVTGAKELSYSQIARETAPDAAWDESKARTSAVYQDQYSTPREEAIAHDVIREAGHGMPCLKLTELDWIRAERILAGLDIPMDDDDVVQDEIAA